MDTEFFKTEKVTEKITRISGIAGELMYLVEGTKQAFLIDTGVGIGNLKNVTDILTDKRVTVLLTHGHVDHALGAGLYDRVYMNLADMSVYKENSFMEHRRHFFDESIPDWKNRVKPEDIIEKPLRQFCELADGQRFDAGNISIEVLSLPGHTPGSMVFLFPEERIILIGDACNTYTFLYDHNSLSVEEYRKNLLKIKKQTDGKYDRILLSHGRGEIRGDLIDSAIALTDDILHGNTDNAPFEFMGEHAYIAKEVDENLRRTDGGIANIVYSVQKVYSQKGKQMV